jgi:NAD(P) transhydrogenase subunit alpha
MSADRLIEQARNLATQLGHLAQDSAHMSQTAEEVAQQAAQAAHSVSQGQDPFMMGLTVFVLAVFVGYYVVWRVTPALHSPLMAITNAISSVIIVGALLAAGLPHLSWAQVMGFLGVVLAGINIFGGFVVTQRMLGMFMSNKKKE